MPSSSSSSESEEDGFKGKSNDDWMIRALGTTGGREVGCRRQAKIEDKKKQEELNQRLLASRQWKPKATTSDSQGKNNDGSMSSSINASSSSSTTPHTISTDFGVSWMQRALDRVYEQAKEKNLPPEEIAADRWGSLDKLKQMLTEAKEKLRNADHDNHGRQSSSSRHHRDYRGHERRDDRTDHRRDGRYEKGDRRRDEGRHRRPEDDHRSDRHVRQYSERRDGDRRDYLREEIESKSITIETKEVDQVKPSPIPSTSSKVYTVQMPQTSSQETSGHSVDQSIDSLELKPLTDAEKNAIHAKILKAEMFGNTKLVQELKSKLEQHDKVKLQSAPKEEVKQITVYKKFNEDEMSIKELFMREKTLDTEKDGQMFAKSSLKRINASKFNPDDEYDIEPKIRKSKDDGFVQEREKKEIEECNNCYSKYPKRLILAFGQHIFLCLGQNEPLVEGHLYIRSINHVPNNLVAADEDVQEEVNKLKQALIEMFSHESKSVIFSESYRKCTKKYDNHMVVECIPMPLDQMTEARLYFKKAILESETEWAINKKLVELKGKHVTRMLPTKLPHFWVTFGSLTEGYGHVIEDETAFQWNFAHEIIGGLLDIEPRQWRKPRKLSYEQQNESVNNLRKTWLTYNPFRNTTCVKSSTKPTS